MKKRFLAMALCLAMTLSLFPTGVFANPENEPAAPSLPASIPISRWIPMSSMWMVKFRKIGPRELPKATS